MLKIWRKSWELFELKIVYSPHSRIVLKDIKFRYGQEKVNKIVSSIRGLADNPKKGASVERLLGISNPYYFLHVERHYVFYKLGDSHVYVNEIFNEREDFLYKLFGIKLRTQESIDYWGE